MFKSLRRVVFNIKKPKNKSFSEHKGLISSQTGFRFCSSSERFRNFSLSEVFKFSAQDNFSPKFLIDQQKWPFCNSRARMKSVMEFRWRCKKRYFVIEDFLVMLRYLAKVVVMDPWAMGSSHLEHIHLKALSQKSASVLNTILVWFCFLKMH